MANENRDVSTGKPDLTGFGHVLKAPVGTQLPTFPDGAFTAFKSLGFLTDDGVDIEFDSETSELTVWGGVTVATTRESFAESIALPMASYADPEVKRFVWGDENVEIDADTGAITAYHNGGDREECMLVIKCMLNDGRKHWIVVPKSKVDEVGGVKYADADIINYPLTMAALAYDGKRTAFDITEALEPDQQG